MNRGGSDAKAIFTAALELAAGPDRAAYLAGACGDDAGLRRRVEQLLAAHERASDILGPSSDPATTATDAASIRAAASAATEPDDPDRTNAHTPSPGAPEVTTSLGSRHADGEGDGLARGETLRYFG